jgi:hypothetical protein
MKQYDLVAENERSTVVAEYQAEYCRETGMAIAKILPPIGVCIALFFI